MGGVGRCGYCVLLRCVYCVKCVAGLVWRGCSLIRRKEIYGVFVIVQQVGVIIFFVQVWACVVCAYIFVFCCHGISCIVM